MILETLYKKSKTGVVVYCEIGTNGSDIMVETGQVGTNKPTFHKTQCEAKNTGKASATTAEEQAIKEAAAKHKKKIKDGYVLDESGVSDVRLPMKVKGYPEQKKNVKFPCWMSYKRDGVNGIYRKEDVLKMTSRGGEDRPGLPHLEDDLQLMMNALGQQTVNGEVYKHDMHLQDITSATTKPNQSTPNLEFHIFDLPEHSGTWLERMNLMNSVCLKLPQVKIAHSIKAISHEGIETFMTMALEQGFEGIIIRNEKGTYEYNERSSDVFKYKIAKDGEYEVIGHKLDKYGHAVWECVCNISAEKYLTTRETMIPKDQKVFDKGFTFSVKRKGTAEERLAEAAIAESKHGSWLKIELESFSKANKPLKPVGIVWRECDADGNPLV